MAQKTSGEFEKEFMEGLRSSTGSDLQSWMRAIDGFGSEKRNEVIAWLKTEHGFGHMNASLLAGIHANGGKPVYQSTDSLLDAQFAKAAEMRPLFESFLKFFCLHNQMHAFDNTICCVDKDKRETPAYALAVTHNKELWAIFKRVWKFKDDQPQRSQHLELFATEVRELRESLQALK